MKFTIILLIILSLLLSSCTKTEEVVVHKSYKTFSVEDGSLSVQDTIIAPVEGSMTSNLSFKTSGRIGSITVRPGDTVKKGQLLARLTNQEGTITYDGLGNVIQNIGAIQRTTATMRNNTEQMRNATRKLYDEQIAQAETNIESLELQLEKTKKNLNNQTATLDTNYHIHVNAFLKLADSMIYEADKILGISTNFEYSNDAWDPYLGLRLGSIKTDAHNAWGKLYTIRGEILAKREKNIVITSDNAEAEIDYLSESFKSLSYLAMTMGSMLENSMIGGDLSEERLNGWIAQWSGFKSNEQAAELQFAAWRDSSTSLMSTATGGSSVASMDTRNIEIQIESAKKNIDVLKAEKESKIQEIGVNISTIDGKNSELEMQLSETSMNQFLAQESIDGAVIYAPFDGVILEKSFDIGNMVQAGTPIFTITSNDTPIIKTFVDNYQYNYKKGDTVSLKNTYTKESFTGTISLIQSEKDPLHNKNYTEITPKGYSGSLGERMDINLSHKKSPQEDGAIIPLSSIVTRYGPPGVFIIENGKAHYTLIEILASDMNYAEVLGVPKKSIIITDGKENIIDGEDLPEMKKE